ncbi:response regulator transcription factor [uncultured Oxalicibacterium sp.]|uniref:response regulator transcription factor n=1 Tax=uncultured Oxalicibacterium sp. TaxID=1168540 RepID=UPI0025F4DA13|nr:response regulator transcription factor [uncultured Oxalicibacterium sp.]
MTTVLLLEDELDLREEIADFLQGEGYRVLEASTTEEFQSLLFAFDIAVIDVGLPDGDGLAIAADLREQRPQCGIIMLTAQSAVHIKLASLRDSSDAYLVKPVSFDELLAHLQSLQRRVASKWRLHLVERHLTAPNQHCEVLNDMETNLLQILAQHAGEVVTRRAIAAAFGVAWLEFDDRRLDQLVSRLRRRWLKATGAELPIRTDHGKGFTFTSEIDVV